MRFSVTWQLGLVEREIDEILRGRSAKEGPRASTAAHALAKQANCGEGDDSGKVEQRPIGEDDVCPICQEELLAKHLPVTYCK